MASWTRRNREATRRTGLVDRRWMDGEIASFRLLAQARVVQRKAQANVPDPTDFTFDELSLFSVVPALWTEEEQPRELAGFLELILTPESGRAWLGTDHDGWIPSTDRESIRTRLTHLEQIWTRGLGDLEGFFEPLSTEGRCAVFMDADGFRALARDTSGLPDTFFVGLQIEWGGLPSAGEPYLIPTLRITNYWPASPHRAPPDGGAENPKPVGASQAADLLENGYLDGILDRFMDLRSGFQFGFIPVVLGEEPVGFPVFYSASPTRRPEAAEAYLEGSALRALNYLSYRLLDSTDLRSTGITGGVVEGCLATFNHSPSVQSDTYLVLPLDGFPPEYIELRTDILVRTLHFLDLDAALDVVDITHELTESREFSSLWSRSAETGMGLIDLLYSLLKKASIQERMYVLTHLMGGFLARLRSRTYADSMKRKELRRKLEGLLEKSMDISHKLLTVQKISGIQILGASEGRARANRGLAQILDGAADQAEVLAEQIGQFARSLSHAASLEEQKEDRERKRLLQAEEKAAKRLNLVLAAVAGMAAIPLIFGGYDRQALVAEIGDWILFDYGVQISFFLAWCTVLGILLVLGINRVLGTTSNKEPAGTILPRLSHLSDRLYDGYREYEHPALKDAVFRDIRPLALDRSGTWEDASVVERTARRRVHELDRRVAGVVAESLQQASKWETGSQIPESDEEWAEDLERRIGRFVLLGDVVDLRPGNLHLPMTLAIHRFRPDAAGLARPAVSDQEFEEVLMDFGFSYGEVRSILAWGSQDGIGQLPLPEFVQACEDFGITALHENQIPMMGPE